MNQVCRDIFRAIHEGKWLKIEYRNKSEQVTRYWIGILDLDSRNRMLRVDGLFQDCIRRNNPYMAWK